MANRIFNFSGGKQNNSAPTTKHPLELIKANKFNEFVRIYPTLGSIQAAFPQDPNVAPQVQEALLNAYEITKRNWLTNRELNFKNTAYGNKTIFDQVEQWLVKNTPSLSPEKLAQLEANPDEEALQAFSQDINQDISQAYSDSYLRSSQQSITPTPSPATQSSQDRLLTHFPDLDEQILNGLRLAQQHQQELAAESSSLTQTASSRDTTQAAQEALTTDTGTTAYHLERQQELTIALEDAVRQAKFRNPSLGRQIEAEARKFSANQGISTIEAEARIVSQVAANLAAQVPKQAGPVSTDTHPPKPDRINRAPLSATAMTLVDDKTLAKKLETAIQAKSKAETVSLAQNAFTGDDSQARAEVLAEIVHNNTISTDNKIIAAAELFTNTPLDLDLPLKAAAGGENFRDESFRRYRQAKTQEGVSPDVIDNQLQLVGELSSATTQARQQVEANMTRQVATELTPSGVSPVDFSQVASDPTISWDEKTQQTATLIAQANDRTTPTQVDLARATQQINRVKNYSQQVAADQVEANQPTTHQAITTGTLHTIYQDPSDETNIAAINQALAAVSPQQQIDQLTQTFTNQGHPAPQLAAETIVAINTGRNPIPTQDIPKTIRRLILDSDPSEQEGIPTAAPIEKALKSTEKSTNTLDTSPQLNQEAAQIAAVRNVVQRKVMESDIAAAITAPTPETEKVKVIADIMQDKEAIGDRSMAENRARELITQINQQTTTFLQNPDQIPPDPISIAAHQAVETITPSTITPTDLDRIASDSKLTQSQKVEAVSRLMATSENSQTPSEFQRAAEEALVVYQNKAQIARIASDPRLSTTDKKSQISQLYSDTLSDTNFTPEEVTKRAGRILTKVENETSAVLNKPETTAIDISNDSKFYVNQQAAQIAAVKENTPEGVNRDALARIILSEESVNQKTAELIAQSRGETNVTKSHQKEASDLVHQIRRGTEKYLNNPDQIPIDNVQKAQYQAVKNLTPSRSDSAKLAQTVTDIRLSEKERVQKTAELFAIDNNEVLGDKHFKQARQFLKEVDHQTDQTLNAVVAESVQERHFPKLTAQQTTLGAVFSSFDEQTAINISNALNAPTKESQLNQIQRTLEVHGQSPEIAAKGAALIVESAQGSIHQTDVAKAITAASVGADLGNSVTEAKTKLASLDSQAFKQVLVTQGLNQAEAERLTTQANAISGEPLHTNNRTILLDKAVDQSLKQDFANLNKETVVGILNDSSLSRKQQVDQLREHIAVSRGIQIDSQEARSLTAQLEKSIDGNYLSITTENKVVLDNNLPLSTQTAQEIVSGYIAAGTDHQTRTNMEAALRAATPAQRESLLAQNFQNLGYDAQSAVERAAAVRQMAEGEISLDAMPELATAVFQPGDDYKQILDRTQTVSRPKIDTLSTAAKQLVTTPLGVTGTNKVEYQKTLGQLITNAQIDNPGILAASIASTEIGLQSIPPAKRVDFLHKSQSIFTQDLTEAERVGQLNDLLAEFNVQQVDGQGFLSRYHQISGELGVEGLTVEHGQTLSNFVFHSNLPQTNATLGESLDAAIFTNQGLLLGDLTQQQLDQLGIGISLSDGGKQDLQIASDVLFANTVGPIERYTNTNLGTIPLYESGTPINFQNLNDFLAMAGELPAGEGNKGAYAYLIQVNKARNSGDFIGVFDSRKPTFVSDVLPFNPEQLNLYLQQGYLVEYRLSTNAIRTIAQEGFYQPVPMSGLQQFAYRSPFGARIPFLRTVVPEPIHYQSFSPMNLSGGLPPQPVPNQGRLGRLFGALSNRLGINKLLSGAGNLTKGLANLTPQGRALGLLKNILPKLMSFLGGAPGLLGKAAMALSSFLIGLLPSISPFLAVGLAVAGVVALVVDTHTTNAIVSTFIKPREEVNPFSQFIDVEKGVEQITLADGESCFGQGSISPNPNAPSSLTYEENEDFPGPGQRCFQYTVRIQASQDSPPVQIQSASDYFEFVTDAGSVRVDPPEFVNSDVQPGAIPGPPFSGNDQNNVTTTLQSGDTVYYAYRVDFDEEDFPDTFEDLAIRNNFRVSLSFSGDEGGSRATELDNAIIRIGDAPIIGGEGCWPTEGRITQLPFSSAGGYTTHLNTDSYDIAAPIGEPIFAPVSGTGLVYPNNSGFSCSGNMFVISTGAGDFMFMHLSDYASEFSRSGVEVTAGQVIGYVGMTSGDYYINAAGERVACQISGPHLHYEYRANWTVAPLCGKQSGGCAGEPSTLAGIVPADINGDVVTQIDQMVSSDTCGSAGGGSTSVVGDVGCFSFVNYNKNWTQDEIDLVTDALIENILNDDTVEALACENGIVNLRRNGDSCTDKGGSWAGWTQSANLVDIYDCLFVGDFNSSTYGRFSVVHEIAHIIRNQNLSAYDALVTDAGVFDGRGATSFYDTIYPYKYENAEDFDGDLSEIDLRRENSAEAFAACRMSGDYRGGGPMPTNFAEQCTAINNIIDSL